MTNESDRQFPFIAPPKPAPDAMREALQKIANLSLTSQAIPEVRSIVTEALSVSMAQVGTGEREATVYTVLTKFLPKDATLDELFQELKEALRDAR